MAGHYPYYVRRGWVDEDGHIRVIESSLKIMNNTVDDVYDEEEAEDDDSSTGTYTYPAPSDDTNDNVCTIGYYYLGGMIELVDSMPSSPIEETTPSPLAADGGAEDGELDQLATVTTSQPNLHFHLLALSADNTYSLGHAGNIYNQSLPYANTQSNEQNRLPPQSRSIALRPNMSMRHDLTSTYANFTTSHLLTSLPAATPHVMAPPVLPNTGYAPPAPNMTSLPSATFHTAAPPTTTHTSYALPTPNMTSFPTTGLYNAAPPALPQTGFAPLAPNTTYPYRPSNAPTPWPGAPILSLPAGPRIGQPVPADLHPIINAIRNLRLIANTEHPERKVLKKPYEKSYQNASRDGQLIRDHFASGSGLLKNDSPLKAWYGDLDIFSEKMWEFLAVQKARLIRGV